jgi:hypothetical protein
VVGDTLPVAVVAGVGAELSLEVVAVVGVLAIGLLPSRGLAFTFCFS